jgi:Uma2 family endonuclease
MAFPALASTWIENGDRLSQLEFHRRYEQRPDLKKAELVEGVVHVPSPVRARQHGGLEGDAGAWLGVYKADHPGLQLNHNTTVILDARNEVQPDICLRRIDGGSSRLVDDYIEGPPELVVEIAASSASIDLHAKKDLYRRTGVQEYIVWRVFDEAIDWWELRDDDYVTLAPDAEGVVHSNVFPGLRLKPADLLAGDLAAVLALPNAPGHTP